MEISARKMSRQLWDMWRAVATLDSKAAAGQGNDNRAWQRAVWRDDKAATDQA